MKGGNKGQQVCPICVYKFNSIQVGLNLCILFLFFFCFGMWHVDSYFEIRAFTHCLKRELGSQIGRLFILNYQNSHAHGGI